MVSSSYHLIRVAQDDDRYLVTIGTELRVILCGERSWLIEEYPDYLDLADDNVPTSYDYWHRDRYPFERLFYYTDKYGATTSEMFWEHSTYIQPSSGDYAVLRRDLKDYAASLIEGNTTYQGESFEIPTGISYGFGNIDRADIAVVADGIEAWCSTSFQQDILEAFGEQHIPFENSINGAALLTAAKKIIDTQHTTSPPPWNSCLGGNFGRFDYEYTIFGIVATIGFLTFIDSAETTVGRPDYTTTLGVIHQYDDLFETYHWTELYTALRAIIDRLSTEVSIEAPDTLSLRRAYIDLLRENKHPISVITEYVKHGTVIAGDISGYITNGVDPDFVRSVAS